MEKPVKVEVVKMAANSGMQVEMPLADFLKFYQEKQGDMVVTRQAVLDLAGARAKSDRNIQGYQAQIEAAKALLDYCLSTIQGGDPVDVPARVGEVAKSLAVLVEDEDFAHVCLRRIATDAAAGWTITTPDLWGENAYGPAW